MRGRNVLDLGAVSGTSGFSVSGSGAVVLSAGVGSFTGTATVNGGNLVVIGQAYSSYTGATGPLGSQPVSLGNGTLILSLGTNSSNPSTFDMTAGNLVTLLTGANSIIASPGPETSLALAGGTVNLAASGGSVGIPAGQRLNLGASGGYTLTIDPGLQFSNSGTISAGPGAISLAAANLLLAGTLSAASGGTLTLSDPMSGGYYAPAAGGTVILSDTTVGYSGTLANLAPLAGGTLVIADNVTAGTLTIKGGAYEATNSLSFGPTVLSLDGGTLAAATALTGSNAIGNVLTLTTSGAGSRTLNFGGSSMLQLSAPLVLSGTTTINDPGGVGILSGVISGSGLLSLSGSPTLTNANTYGGGTKLNSGEVVISYDQSFGTGSINFNNGGIEAASLLAGASALTNAWSISKGSAAYFGASSGTDSIQLTGNAALPASNTEYIHITNPGLTVTLSGLISGNSNLTRGSDAAGQVNGTLVLNNAGNTFQNFQLQSLGGAVDVQGASTLPAGATGNSITSGPLGTKTITLGSTNSGSIALENSSPVAVTLGNTLQIEDPCSFISVSGLTFAGAVTLTGSGQGSSNNHIIDFSVGANSNIAFTGQISGVDGVNLRSGSGVGGLR